MAKRSRAVDREDPGNSRRIAARSLDRDPIRELHQGPRSYEPHREAGHMTAPDHIAGCAPNPLAGGGRPHMNSGAGRAPSVLTPPRAWRGAERPLPGTFDRRSGDRHGSGSEARLRRVARSRDPVTGRGRPVCASRRDATLARAERPREQPIRRSSGICTNSRGRGPHRTGSRRRARRGNRPESRAVTAAHRAAARSYRIHHLEHRDPADRLLIATAIELGCPLVTYDERIIQFGKKRGRQEGFSIEA